MDYCFKTSKLLVRYLHEIFPSLTELHWEISQTVEIYMFPLTCRWPNLINKWFVYQLYILFCTIQMCVAYKSASGAINTFSPQRQVSGEVQMQSQSRGLDPIAMTMATVGMGMSLYSARQMTEEEYLKHLNAWVESCWGGAALTEVNDVCGCVCRRRSVRGETGRALLMHLWCCLKGNLGECWV